MYYLGKKLSRQISKLICNLKAKNKQKKSPFSDKKGGNGEIKNLLRLNFYCRLSFAVVAQEEQSKRSRSRMRAYYLVDVIDYDVLTFALVADKVGKILRVLYTVAVRDVNQLIFLVVSFLVEIEFAALLLFLF